MSVLERLSKLLAAPEVGVTSRLCTECRATVGVEVDACPECGGDIRTEEVDAMPQYWGMY